MAVHMYDTFPTSQSRINENESRYDIINLIERYV